MYFPELEGEVRTRLNSLMPSSIIDREAEPYPRLFCSRTFQPDRVKPADSSQADLGAAGTMPASPKPVNIDALKALVRTVPDFPKPGILFYDITTLLKDKTGFAQLIDA